MSRLSRNSRTSAKHEYPFVLSHGFPVLGAGFRVCDLGRGLGFAVPAILGPTGAPPKRATPGVCATYGKALMLAVSRSPSYDKMVLPATPYGKNIPTQGSDISKIGEGAR